MEGLSVFLNMALYKHLILRVMLYACTLILGALLCWSGVLCKTTQNWGQPPIFLLDPVVELIPDFEETVPGPGADGHPVLRDPEAADAVVMPSQNAYRGGHRFNEKK